MRIEGLKIIYKITNSANQVYIGQSVDWMKRFYQYKNGNCKSQKLLYKSIKKYGWENHKIELIEYCDLKNANNREIYYINYYNCYYKNNKLGLNLTLGGENFSCRAIKNRVKKIKRKILQYDLEGNFVKEWKSIKEAAKNLNMHISSIVSVLCKRYKSRKGFQWKYYKDNYELKIDSVIVPKVKRVTKSILQYSNNGDFIKEFNSITEAGKITGINPKVISNVLLGYNKFGGNFHWKYKEENYLLKIQKIDSAAWYKFCKFKAINLENSMEIYSDTIEELAKHLNINKQHLCQAIKHKNGLLKLKKIQVYIIT